MPATLPQSIDRFFTSHFDYNVFLQWIQDVRGSLISINQNLDSDPKILARTLETAKTSLAYQNASKAEIIRHRKDNEPFITQAALAIELASNLEMQAQNNEINLLCENDVYPFIVTDGTNKLNDEIKNYKKSDEDLNNPIPDNKRLNTNSRNNYGAIQTQYYTSTNFPVQGTEWVDNTSLIADTMNSAVEFEVVSGYKASTDKTPNDKEFKSWVIVKNAGTDKSKWESDPKATFTPERPYSDYANEVLDQIQAVNNKGQTFPGSYKFFIEKLHGRYSDGSPYKMNGIKSQRKPKGDRNLTNRMVFSAYIDNYNDSYSVNWGDYNFIGRADPVFSYKSTTREMTLEFTLLADYSTEVMAGMEQLNKELGRIESDHKNDLLEKLIKNIGVDWGLGQISQPNIYNDERVGGHVPGMYSDTPEGLWSKITFLAQCCYPYYRDDGKMKEQPMIRMRIADFYDVVIAVKSFQLQMNQFDGPIIDLNPSSLGNMPFGMKVTMNGTIIHNYEPSSNYYGFYNRKEFDLGTKNPVTGLTAGNSLIDLQNGLMNLGSTVNSPLSFDTIFNNDKLLSVNDISGLGISAVQALQANLNNFQRNFNSLKNSTANITDFGTSLTNAYIKQKTAKSMEAFNAVQDVLSYLRVIQGTSVAPSNSFVANLTGKKSAINFETTQINGLGTTPADKWVQIVEDVKTAKNTYNEIKTDVNTAKKVAGAVNAAIHGDLDKLGTNFLEQAALSEASKVAAGIIANKTKQPKTIGDIMEAGGGNANFDTNTNNIA